MSKSTWNTQPASGEWNTAANWTPAETPSDTATFSASSQTAISFSKTGAASINSIEFTEDAPTYTFTFDTCDTAELTISGAGVTNHSNKQQSFIVAATSSGYKNPQLKFINNASAGGDDLYYCAGPETQAGYGGGVIRFEGTSSAGSAAYKAWCGAGIPPKEGSTVGGEISFGDSATADNARFTIYGSLGTDGDTFGNVVFHNNSTAANGTFTNIGGTVSGGDGGNTQFYENTTAANGVFNNWGGTHPKANGGDVAFDGVATGANGHFYQHAAVAPNAYGGVTSFNNNWPDMEANQGASAGNGAYFNYGAREGEQGGGGHMEFSAKYGSPTGANARINNYGSLLASKSSAGHTIFSINLPTKYFPTAGKASIWNHPAPNKAGAAGFTEFSVYSDSKSSEPAGAGSPAAGANVPTAGNATLINLGGTTSEAAGGYTVFSANSSAGGATLIAYGGSNGGYGGKIAFYDDSTGSSAKVQLFGNAELDLSYHNNGLTLASLTSSGGSISTKLGSQTTPLKVKGSLKLEAVLTFYFDTDDSFTTDTRYSILSSEQLSDYSTEQFSGNSINGVEPTFTISGNNLLVSFD